MCVCVCICVYINVVTHVCTCKYIYIYIYDKNKWKVDKPTLTTDSVIFHSLSSFFNKEWNIIESIVSVGLSTFPLIFSSCWIYQNLLYIYIYIYRPVHWHNVPMVLETRVQSQVESIQRLKKKMVLDTSLFNTQHYKVGIKGKSSNPGKGVAPSRTPRCSSYWKVSLWVALDNCRPTY